MSGDVKLTRWRLADGQIIETHPDFYVASCDPCGWFGSSQECGTDSWGDDSDVYCPRCYTGGADNGKVAQHAVEIKAGRSALSKAQDDLPKEVKP